MVVIGGSLGRVLVKITLVRTPPRSGGGFCYLLLRDGPHPPF
ncbi:hypothetical protein CGRA01v4_08972 [Colletotrichum graminicola]|nr:hypothetical protein CGRA01v4_08972 [Colletotrichum graminicola]